MLEAIEATLEKGIKTGDIGGHSTMYEVVEEILNQLQ